MLNLIKFLKCNKSKTRLSIIKNCIDKMNIYKHEDYLKFQKQDISDFIVYPEDVRVVEEKNIKINVKYN